MTKRKRKKDTMSGVTIAGITGLAVTGAIPNSLDPNAAGIKAGFSTGVSNIGTALPVMWKVKGTKMVLKSTGKLKKSLKKFKFKGGIKLWN